MLCQGCWIVDGVRKGLYPVEALSIYLNSFEINSSAAVVATFRRNLFSRFPVTLVSFSCSADE